VVLEVNLDNFVAKSEHYGVFGSHPLLNINWRILHTHLIASFRADDFTSLTWKLLVLVVFQVRSEVLKQSDLLLKILRVVSKVISLHDILLLSGRYSLSLIVEESVTIRVNDDLRAIIKENSSCQI
jgi:hypothetical protein